MMTSVAPDLVSEQDADRSPPSLPGWLGTPRARCLLLGDWNPIIRVDGRPPPARQGDHRMCPMVVERGSDR
jgi:hypothetical protein